MLLLRRKTGIKACKISELYLAWILYIQSMKFSSWSRMHGVLVPPHTFVKTFEFITRNMNLKTIQVILMKTTQLLYSEQQLYCHIYK